MVKLIQTKIGSDVMQRMISQFQIVTKLVILFLFLSSGLWATTVAQYEIADIVLEGGTYSNPYTQVDLAVEFTTPGGSTFALNGFWDGDSTWIIRFTPTIVGDWSYTTTSNDTKLNGLTGTITCTSSSYHGFLQKSGLFFQYENGSHCFRMGDTCWRMFRSKNAAFETHFKPLVNARANQGFNYICGSIYHLGDPNINEGGNLWYDDSNLDSLQTGYFTWVDKRMDYLRSKDFIVGLYLTWAQKFCFIFTGTI